MLNEGSQIHDFISSSGSGTVINYGSGSAFLTSYGSGSGSTRQKVTVPMVPVPVPVPQHWRQRGQCILFSVVFTPFHPSHHGSVWLLPVISILLAKAVNREDKRSRR
jgi:hypothetical protein